MELRDELSAIEIGLAERAEEIRLAVSIRSQTFRGSHDRVWVDPEELQHFATALRRLEAERTGEAVLESLSPEEFRLAFRPASPAGRIAAEAVLTRHQYGNFRRHANTVGCDFEIPGEDLRPLIESFEREFGLSPPAT